MSDVRFYTKTAQCCGGGEFLVRQETFSDRLAGRPSNVLRRVGLRNQAVVDYKALSIINGNSRQYGVKVGVIGSRSRIGQAAQSAVSFAVPGDLSKLRSPIRSGAWSAITPGLPGGIGGGPKRQGRTHRCPEGYQYGGRFTDNRFSTCGAKLFDIPSPLGAAIGALRAAARAGRVTSNVQGRAITAGQYGGNVIDSRAPQIPRVGASNPRVASVKIKELVTDMGKPNIQATRMVRRDGFVLQPVVSAGVLRTIPDNRDMEGATYLTTLGDIGALGGNELGLLSNTGVSSVSWVLPGGSSISISKVRPLTVGERRKLGRTVNQAIKLPNANDPLARLRLVAEETGDGIAVRENFVGIQNPKKIVTTSNGRSVEKWVYELLMKKRGKQTASAPERETVSAASAKISNIDEAIAHLNKGGSLLDIAPSILQKVLSRQNIVKTQNGMIMGPNNKPLVQRTPAKKFGHLHAAFASDVQQHLGFESPDVAFIGKGDKRKYLIESSRAVISGFEPDRNKTFEDVSPADVATLFVADFLTGVDNRSKASVELSKGEGRTSVIAVDNPYPIVDLSSIKIVERSKNKIEEIAGLSGDGVYGKYFRALKAEQQTLFRQQLAKLISRAGRFQVREFKSRLKADGELSTGELQHLDILGKLFDPRLDILRGSLTQVIALLGGKK